MTTPIQMYHGDVAATGDQVLLREGARLPAGTHLLVTPVAHGESRRGSPSAVLGALRSAPHLRHEDVEDLRRAIAERREDVDWEDVFHAPPRNDTGTGK